MYVFVSGIYYYIMYQYLINYKRRHTDHNVVSRVLI